MRLRPSPEIRPLNTWVSDRVARVALRPHGFGLQNLPSFQGDVSSIQLYMRPFTK